MASETHRNGFTALRLLCAFGVLVTHSYGLLGDRAEPLYRISGLVAFGSVGVDGFFAISGFLVCSSLLRNPSAAIYLRNRLLRLVPALAVLVLALVLVLGPLATSAPDYWRDPATWRFLGTVTIYGVQQHLPGVFTDNPTPLVDGSLWTLPMELTCYLLLLALHRGRLLTVRGLGALVVLLLALHLGGVFPAHRLLLRMDVMRLDRFAVLFFTGALFAALGDRARYGLARAGGAFLLVAIAALPQRQALFELIYLPVLPYLLICLGKSVERAAWLNDWDASYGVYLYGYPVQQGLIALFGGGIGTAALTLIAAPITLLLGVLSWRVVERPALSLKNDPFGHEFALPRH